MRAGKLRHRVTIQRLTETRDDAGGLVPTWTDYAQVFASVEPLRGREFFAGQEKQSRVDTRIRIRYLADVTPKMRVEYGAHVYEIVNIIDPEMRHQEMQLMCYEVANV